MKRLYYFAYGRNMYSSAMVRRVGQAKKIGTYRFNGYKLVFNVGSWFSAYGNMIEGNKKDFIEGVLYELSDVQIALLDKYENWPINYQKQYFEHEDGSVIFAYVSTNPDLFTSKDKASREYVLDIYFGAKENGLEHTQHMMKDYLENVIKRPLKKRISTASVGRSFKNINLENL